MEGKYFFKKFNFRNCLGGQIQTNKKAIQINSFFNIPKNNIPMKTFSSARKQMNSVNINKFKYTLHSNLLKFNFCEKRQSLVSQSELLEKIDELEETGLKQYFAKESGEAIKLTNKLEEDMKKRGIINFQDLFKVMEKLNFLSDLQERQRVEEVLLECIRSPNFYKDHLAFPKLENTHQNFANLFFHAAKIKSLQDSDMQMMQEWFFDMDKPSREFKLKQRIMIFDAFYFYNRNFGNEVIDASLSKLHSHIVTNFNEFMTSFLHVDLTDFLVKLIFFEDKEIRLFLDKIVEKMNYIINPDRSNLLQLSLNKKFDIVQSYPKILHVIEKLAQEDKNYVSIYKREKEKLENFLIENSGKVDENDINSEFILCCVSNYNVWVENSPRLLEAYVPYFYNKLGGYRNEMVLEIFFLLLNSNFDNYTNCSKALELVNLIYQLLKNIKIRRLEIYEDLKEADYFYSIRKELIEEFEKWDQKDKAEDFDHPDHYYKKIFREFIRKSVNIYPFSATHYNEQLFDRLFKNLKNYIKFS